MAGQDLASLYMEVVPRAMREFRAELSKRGALTLTLAQYRILASLRQGPTNNRTLAAQQGVSVAAMSRMINWLSRHGLVERLSDQGDRRQVHLRLSPLGRQRIDSFKRQAQKRLQRRFNELSRKDRTSLQAALSALSAALKRLSH